MEKIQLDVIAETSSATSNIDNLGEHLQILSENLLKGLSKTLSQFQSGFSKNFQELNTSIDKLNGTLSNLIRSIKEGLIPSLQSGSDALLQFSNVGPLVGGLSALGGTILFLSGAVGGASVAAVFLSGGLAVLAAGIAGLGVGTAVNELIGLADTSQVVEGAMKSQRLELMNWTLAELEGGKATGDLDRLIRDHVLSLGQANEAAAAHGDAVELVQGRYELVSGALEDAELRETENIYSLALAA